MMPSLNVGVVIGSSGIIYALIKPDDDRELDKECWTRIAARDATETMRVVKITRVIYDAFRHRDELAAHVGGRFADAEEPAP